MKQSEQTLEEIDKLTKLEKHLMDVLVQSSNTADPNVNASIHAIYEAKRTLYSALYRQLLQDSSNAEVAQQVYRDHITAFKIVEDGTNEAKAKYNELQIDNENKLRLIEINDYYGSMYTGWSEIMKSVLIVSILVCVMSALAYAHILPRELFFPLVALIFVGGGAYVGIKVAYALNMDNMNYEQYGWYTQSPGPVNTSNPSGSGTNPWSTSSQLPMCRMAPTSTIVAPSS